MAGHISTLTMLAEMGCKSSREPRVGKEPGKGFRNGDFHRSHSPQLLAPAAPHFCRGGSASFLSTPVKPHVGLLQHPVTTNTVARSSISLDWAQCLVPTMYSINICCTKE